MAEYGKAGSSKQSKNIPKASEKPFKPSARVKSDDELAIEWARSMGYPVPAPPIDPVSSTILVIVAFFLCVIPGVFAFMYVAQRKDHYTREITALRTKWVDAGKPKPGEKGVLPGKLEVLQQKSEDKSIENKLDELKSLNDAGKISDEEYQALRKKALGL